MKYPDIRIPKPQASQPVDIQLKASFDFTSSQLNTMRNALLSIPTGLVQNQPVRRNK